MNLEKEIKEALNQKTSLRTLREIVSRYKQYGGTQQDAYGTLENIRCASIEGMSEDLLLDLMDFVTGFCSKNQRIWDKVLTA
ncbi:MAG: hypothetical protein O7G88_04055 [bacterium]|nr:hypothetical protein [bacterium]